ncbi:MAG: tRNA (adenosine(37)-N6)-threonylcarbamoyltransferase complex dimerization subunit type 1 TsaB, partial [Bacteroidetes bacterium]
MVKFLNIESSGPVCSVCVSDGEQILSLKATEKVFQHTEKITLLIDECMEEAGIKLNDLDAVVISGGPGSYTALRVG